MKTDGSMRPGEVELRRGLWPRPSSGRRGLGLWVGATLLLLGLMAGCLPNPQSVAERRATFPREALRGELGLLGRLLHAVGLGEKQATLILGALPPHAVRVDGEFGRSIKLAGYEIDPAAPAPGDLVHVTLYWTPVREVEEDYQVFVHGDAIGGQATRLHGDHYPALGRYPTDVWQVGEIIVDPFSLWIPPGYGAPQLGLYMGLYKGDYRVPLTNSGLAPPGTENRLQAITISFK
ncbi:MAG: hypothetical protein IPK13_20445 [Deltaproteobacteria bacterium]|nr:hypothetical protein [Deltaproteobacteria bacterium]